MYEKHSSINKRILATSIDFLGLSVILTPVMLLVERIIYGNRNMVMIVQEIADSKGSDNISLVDLIEKMNVEYFFIKYFLTQMTFFIMVGIILSVLWSYFSATPGKWLMSCRVVSADSYEKISLKQAFIRYIGYVISVFPLGIGLFIAAFNKDKKCWHDKIANTVVIDVKHDFAIFDNFRKKIFKK
jgi:uncharacterized RDD family membrane protein YckC